MRTDEEHKISERRIEICKILKEFCETKDCFPNQETVCLKCHHIATALIKAGYRTQKATIKDFLDFLQSIYPLKTGIYLTAFTDTEVEIFLERQKYGH